MKRTWLAVTLAFTIASPGAQAALIITVNAGGGFNANQLAVIEQARQDWLALLTFNGGNHTIRINLTINNDLTTPGATDEWQTDPNGRVITANVQINKNMHNWTTGAPVAGAHDALNTLRHEFTHALGWTVNVPGFGNNVLTLMGNRFYDLARNGQWDPGMDFDLIDDASQGTHAPEGSNDLMEPSTALGLRRAPTAQHAAVLAHAYGYRAVPAPPAVLALALPLLIRSRRRLC